MSIDPEEPELRKLVPLTLGGFGGPVIGHVFVDDHDVQQMYVTGEVYSNLLEQQAAIRNYSIVDLENEDIVPEMEKLFEEFPPGRLTGEMKKSKITIKRKETDGTA